jgi:hypothetical protein
MRSAEATSQKLFGEFGLTPSARTRLFSAVHPVPTTHVTPDAAEQYFEDDDEQPNVQ